MGANGDKHLRILESKTQGAVSTHGDAINRARRTRSQQPETFLHLGNKIMNEKIFVEHVAIARIDVERILRLRSNDHELSQAFLLPRFFNRAGRAAGGKEGLVAAESVQKIN